MRRKERSGPGIPISLVEAFVGTGDAATGIGTTPAKNNAARSTTARKEILTAETS
jgi:hypothetical protein